MNKFTAKLEKKLLIYIFLLIGLFDAAEMRMKMFHFRQRAIRVKSTRTNRPASDNANCIAVARLINEPSTFYLFFIFLSELVNIQYRHISLFNLEGLFVWEQGYSKHSSLLLSHLFLFFGQRRKHK